MSLDYGLTLLAALLIGTGFVLQQNMAQRAADTQFLSLRLIIDLLRKPRWLLGIGAMVAGQILAAWSIGNLPLAFVEPLLATNLVFALILAVPIAKASLRFGEIFGAVVLCVGVALLSVSRSAKPIGLSFGSFSHWPAAGVIAFIALVAVQAGRRRPGRARAMLTGAAAGLVLGIQDALTRQTLQALHSAGISGMLATWAPYALVGAGATGIWLTQSAFSAGPLNVSLPAISAGEPVVGHTARGPRVRRPDPGHPGEAGDLRRGARRARDRRDHGRPIPGALPAPRLDRGEHPVTAVTAACAGAASADAAARPALASARRL